MNGNVQIYNLLSSLTQKEFVDPYVCLDIMLKDMKVIHNLALEVSIRTMQRLVLVKKS